MKDNIKNMFTWVPTLEFWTEVELIEMVYTTKYNGSLSCHGYVPRNLATVRGVKCGNMQSKIRNGGEGGYNYYTF